ncbi:MAG: cation:proton antiporter, partial [Actinobacteria bacterium]|nr:cation:proton antiporter [Actinomycetota bacterium]
MDAEIFYVLVGSVIVAAIARWRGWPAPLLVTVVALAVSFIPAVPNLRIDGHVLLTLVLPPLLYSASLDVSFVSFRRSMPQIRRLGIGLVVVTTAAVGLVAWLLMPSLTLPGALLLGAIVAPPDAVSAAAIGRKLGLPRRVMTVLSGESLINDATSLTLYRVFAAIVAGATVTVWDGIWQFVLAVVVGVGIGVVAGLGMHQLRMRISDPVVIGTFGLLAPFGVYGITEHLQGSGVLGVVAMGLVVGYNAPRTSYATRMQETPIWLSADFLLESFVFAYIGLQLPPVISELGATQVGSVLWLAAAVFVVMLVVRPLFVYPSSAWGAMWTRMRLRRFEKALASGQFRQRADAVAQRRRRTGRGGRHPSEEDLRERLNESQLSWREKAVISWAGMRGVVTLATALAAADLAALD